MTPIAVSIFCYKKDLDGWTKTCTISGVDVITFISIPRAISLHSYYREKWTLILTDFPLEVNKLFAANKRTKFLYIPAMQQAKHGYFHSLETSK